VYASLSLSCVFASGCLRQLSHTSSGGDTYTDANAHTDANGDTDTDADTHTHAYSNTYNSSLSGSIALASPEEF